jgi:ABC-type transport system involved in multi-copper enzyme maturation permease subunit
MTGRRISLVAWHVFKESVRDRVLYSIVAFAIILVAASLLIGQITAGQDLKIIKDLGLATIELAGIVMAVFVGIGLVAREIDRRSIYSLLAKPLPRWEFIVGKYAGLLLTIFVNVALMTVVFYVMLAWIGWVSPENVRRSWEAGATDPALLKAVTLILAELALLTAVALFFSTFSSSAILSLVLTLGLYVAGIESQDLRQFGRYVESPATPLVEAVGWVVPAFSLFDVKPLVVHGLPVPIGLVALRVLYAAIYSAAAVGAGVVIFSRREFK